jgi:iron complex outermembrane receptor protein
MNRQDYANPGVIDNAKLDAAIASGLINLFAREQAPGAIAASGAVGTGTSAFESTLTGGDFRTVGHLADLPAGPLDIALGGEFREESLTGKADALSIPDALGKIGWNGGSSLSPFSARREISAGESLAGDAVVFLRAGRDGLGTGELSELGRYCARHPIAAGAVLQWSDLQLV